MKKDGGRRMRIEDGGWRNEAAQLVFSQPILGISFKL
jgi:hypothetical protein